MNPDPPPIDSQIDASLRLVPILRSGGLAESVELTEFGKMVIQPTIENYPPGSNEPEWPCFVLARGEQGLASQTARRLVQHAWQRAPTLTLTAETLQVENASVRILRGIGFELTDTDRLDPDEGVPVWHWRLAPR